MIAWMYCSTDLDHELRDDAVENAALVVERLARRAHALLACMTKSKTNGI